MYRDEPVLLTVEPLNKGHVRTNHSVIRREVVRYSEVKQLLVVRKMKIWDSEEACPLYGCCFYCVLPSEGPLSEGLLSIGGFTVVVIINVLF